MRRARVYLCSLLFLALTAVKMISPAAAADVRQALVPVISEDDDYQAVLAAARHALEGEGTADAVPYTVTPPIEQLAQTLTALRPDYFAGLPQSAATPAPESTSTPTPEPTPESTPEEPETSAAMQAAYAARDTFLAAQAAFADYAVPANVSYDVPELPFAYATPVAGYTSSGFGYRLHPIQNVVKFHHGTDFAANAGTEICAFADGTVLAAGEDDGYGNYVKIDHGSGYVTLYGHCSELLVSAGQQVSRGERIALVGATGQATGPHLHLELLHNGVYLNPEFYLSA